MQSDNLWKKIIIPGRSSKMIQVILNKYAGEYTSVVKWTGDRQSDDHVNKMILDTLTRKCPNLQELKIALYGANEDLSIVLGNGLQHLDLCTVEKGYRDRIKLQDIISANGEGFHHLCSLTLGNYELQLSKSSVKQLSVSSVFRTLKVEYCEIISDALDCFISSIAPTLVKLVIFDCGFHSDISLARFIETCGENCRNLEIFHLDDVEIYRDNDPDLGLIKIRRAIATLSNNKSMQSLLLRGNKKTFSIPIDDIGMRAMAHSMADLKELTLDCCDETTDEILCVLGSSFNKLQNLTLNHCYNVTDRGLEALSNHPSVKEFHFCNFTEKVSREAIVRTLSIMPVIEKVEITSGYYYQWNYHSLDDKCILDRRLEEEIKMTKPNIHVKVRIS